MLLRLLLVVVLVAIGAVITAAYRRRRMVDQELGAVDERSGEARWPDLPAELGPADRPTWVIFTTPLCVSCDAVRADLLARSPGSRVITVDATERPDLSDRYGVRRAPTTILADAGGRIAERLVGIEAVRDHLRDPGRSSLAG